MKLRYTCEIVDLTPHRGDMVFVYTGINAGHFGTIDYICENGETIVDFLDIPGNGLYVGWHLEDYVIVGRGVKYSLTTGENKAGETMHFYGIPKTNTMEKFKYERN